MRGGPSSSLAPLLMAKSRPVRPARTCASTRSTSVVGAAPAAPADDSDAPPPPSKPLAMGAAAGGLDPLDHDPPRHERTRTKERTQTLRRAPASRLESSFGVRGCRPLPSQLPLSTFDSRCLLA